MGEEKGSRFKYGGQPLPRPLLQFLYTARGAGKSDFSLVGNENSLSYPVQPRLYKKVEQIAQGIGTYHHSIHLKQSIYWPHQFCKTHEQTREGIMPHVNLEREHTQGLEHIPLQEEG